MVITMVMTMVMTVLITLLDEDHVTSVGLTLPGHAKAQSGRDLAGACDIDAGRNDVDRGAPDDLIIRHVHHIVLTRCFVDAQDC